MDWSTGTPGCATIWPATRARLTSVWSDGPVGNLAPRPSEKLPFLQESGFFIQRRRVNDESLSEFECVTERSITTLCGFRMGFEREAMNHGRLALTLVRCVHW